MRTAGLLLAAGAGSRFGDVKQLTPIDGKPMVQHCLESLTPIFGEDMYTVLGAACKDIRPLIDGLSHVIKHDQWQKGIGSSIARAMIEIEAQGSFDAVLIALADQVRLTESDFNKLLDRFDGIQIVAAHYADSIGVPAVFPARFFDQLKQLSGDRGAKSILQAMSHELIKVSLPMAEFDIDVVEDL